MQSPPRPEFVSIGRVALLGNDYRGLALEALCEVDDQIRAGAALVRDTRQPERRITAAVSGRVVDIDRGTRRRLDRLIIEIDERVDALRFDPPRNHGRESLRKFMLETGAWCSLRSRPFGNVPLVDTEPAAIFVNAIETGPASVVPQMLIDSLRDEFEAGIGALSEIAAGMLYVCHAAEYDPGLGERDRLRCVAFGGGFQAGMPGVHIHRLCPIGFAGREVWQIGYQDVIALGWLLLRATPWPWRAVSIRGNGVDDQRVVGVPPGASIDDLLRSEMKDEEARMDDGCPMYARPTGALPAYLAAGQRQLAVQDYTDTRPAPAPGRSGAIIPSDLLDQVVPPGIYPVPLMRALQIGDAERARQLGALELLEEDLAPLSRVCVSGNDYGKLLRRVLDRLEAQL